MTQPNATRPRWEMADVVRLFGESYRATRRLPFSHLRVLTNIQQCRTAVLGGHMEECDRCTYRRAAYNSCGNRHCPKCGAMAKEEWLAARRAELLPVPYFHKVFTLPHELNALTLANKKVVLGLLFKATSETLSQFGTSRLGGKVGFTLVLHTWNQKLLDHFHLHCVIPAGALADDGQRWIPAKYTTFLFPVKALAVVFRAKFLALLEEAGRKGDLLFPGDLAPLSAPQIFDELLLKLRRKAWVVYSKAPFHGGPEQVLDYLGRYTHRVALSNHRLVHISEGGVTFCYRDRSDGNSSKVMTVSGHEFLRRFLLHVLPRGFQRIRHYGLLAARTKAESLAQCRAALAVTDTPTKPAPQTATQRLLEVAGIDVLKCPCCQLGRMQRGAVIPRSRPAFRIPSLVECLNSS